MAACTRPLQGVGPALERRRQQRVRCAGGGGCSCRRRGQAVEANITPAATHVFGLHAAHVANGRRPGPGCLCTQVCGWRTGRSWAPTLWWWPLGATHASHRHAAAASAANVPPRPAAFVPAGFCLHPMLLGPAARIDAAAVQEHGTRVAALASKGGALHCETSRYAERVSAPLHPGPSLLPHLAVAQGRWVLRPTGADREPAHGVRHSLPAHPRGLGRGESCPTGGAHQLAAAVCPLLHRLALQTRSTAISWHTCWVQPARPCRVSCRPAGLAVPRHVRPRGEPARRQRCARGGRPLAGTAQAV